MWWVAESVCRLVSSKIKLQSLYGSVESEHLWSTTEPWFPRQMWVKCASFCMQMWWLSVKELIVKRVNVWSYLASHVIICARSYSRVESMSPLFDVRFGTKSMCHIDSMVGFLDAFISPFASVCMVVGFSPALIPCLLKSRCKFRCVYPSIIYKKSTFSNPGCPASGGFWDRHRHFLGEVDQHRSTMRSRQWRCQNPQIRGPEGQLSTKRERKSAPCALGECSDQWDTNEKIVSPNWNPKLQIASAHFTFTPYA